MLLSIVKKFTIKGCHLHLSVTAQLPKQPDFLPVNSQTRLISCTLAQWQILDLVIVQHCYTPCICILVKRALVTFCQFTLSDLFHFIVSISSKKEKRRFLPGIYRPVRSSCEVTHGKLIENSKLAAKGQTECIQQIWRVFVAAKHMNEHTHTRKRKKNTRLQTHR